MTIRVAPTPVRRVRAEWHRPPQRVEQPGVDEIPERAASVGQPAGRANTRRDATPANEIRKPEGRNGEPLVAGLAVEDHLPHRRPPPA